MKTVILTFNPNGTYHCHGLPGAALPLYIDGLRQAGCHTCPEFARCTMSSWSKDAAGITDLEALEAASKELGFEWVKAGSARGWGGALRPAPYVIRIAKAKFDIAVTPSKDGQTYELATDWHGNWMAQHVGDKYGKLLQHYGVHKAGNYARKMGKIVTRTFIPQSNTVKLHITGY